jgi:hypothetical protein
MTCRARLKIEHPECVSPAFCAGCKGCPEDYGYLDTSETCAGDSCDECWDREADAPVTEVGTIKEIFTKFRTQMHNNISANGELLAHCEEGDYDAEYYKGKIDAYLNAIVCLEEITQEYTEGQK